MILLINPQAMIVWLVSKLPYDPLEMTHSKGERPMRLEFWGAALIASAITGAIVYGQTSSSQSAGHQTVERPDAKKTLLSAWREKHGLSKEEAAAAEDHAPQSLVAGPAVAETEPVEGELPPIIDVFTPLTDQIPKTENAAPQQPARPAGETPAAKRPPVAGPAVQPPAVQPPATQPPLAQQPLGKNESKTIVGQSAAPQNQGPQPRRPIAETAQTSSLRLRRNIGPSPYPRFASGKPAPIERQPNSFAAKQNIPPNGPAERQPLPHENVARDHHVVAATHEIANAGRELMDAGRVYAQAHTPTPGSDAKRNGHAPGLSNYYGDVTINYIVTPNGSMPTVAPISFNQQPAGPPGIPMMPAPDPLAGSPLDVPAAPGHPHAPYAHHHGPAPFVPPPPYCACDCCCKYRTSHCFGVFAEAMWVRPSNVDVIYAREQIGCDPATATPTGPVGSVNPDDELGYRLGFVFPLCDISSLSVSYSWYGADTSSAIHANPNINGAVIASKVTHPSLGNCAANSLGASATYDIYVEMVELDYRRLWCGGCGWQVNWFGGVRYGRLEQQLHAQQIVGSGAGQATVDADIDFDGLGVGLGLEAETRSHHTGLFVYGRGEASFLGGSFSADYMQVNQFDVGVPIANSLEDYRLVSVLEAELGIGWSSRCGRIRAMGGYSASGWFNTLLLNNYLDSIRHSSYGDHLDDTFGLNGIVARFEFRH